MKRKVSPIRKTDNGQIPDQKPGKIEIILTLIFFFLSLFITWLTPRMLGDLFIALAGGRDVLAGGLSTPDTWAFTTEGRVWINQNWGSGLLFYLSYKFTGEWGLLALKGILIILCGLFTLLAVLKRKQPLIVSVFVVSLELFTLFPYIDLRPNLLTLVFTALTLWIIYMSWEKPLFVWLSVLAVTLWSNLHGGFYFGIIMLFLLAFCKVIVPIFLDKKPPAGSEWNFPLAAIASIILPGILNPFGFTNITHPFLIANSKEWQFTDEWHPIWGQANFGHTGFFIVITLLIVPAVLYFFISVWFNKGRTPDDLKAGKEEKLIILFDTLLIIISTLMAFGFRRFIPLAVIVNAVVAVKLISGLLHYFKNKKLFYILIAAAYLFIGVIGMTFIDYYLSGSPGTTFSKMHRVNTGFPVNLAEYINRNKIRGNMFCDWSWEGYMKWQCPEVKVFIGGRAQQVYDLNTLRKYNSILDGNVDMVKFVKNNNIGLIALSGNNLSSGLIEKMGMLSGVGWERVFDDGKSFLLVDASRPEFKDLPKEIQKS